MVNDLRCLACSAAFDSRKQLSAHRSQCTLSFSLTDQIFSRKRKSEKKKKRKDKRARRGESLDRLPDDVVIPEQREVRDIMSVDPEQFDNDVRALFATLVLN
jgi:hypothetical protein